jgi:hypothetical protein
MTADLWTLIGCFTLLLAFNLWAVVANHFDVKRRKKAEDKG